MDNLVFDALQYETTNFEDFAVMLALEHDTDGNLLNSIPDWISFNSAFYSNHGIDFNVVEPAAFSVNISGPGYLNFKQQGTFTANASGGISPYASYNWQKKYDGSSNWENAGTADTIYQTMNHKAFTLKVTVIDYEGRTTTDTHYVSNSVWRKAPGDEDQIKLPKEYALDQNYPNPFNPVTTIKYSLKEAGPVHLKVYNIMGQTVKVLVNESLPAGEYEIAFDALSLPSGIYYYSLEAGHFKSVKKMTLLK